MTKAEKFRRLTCTQALKADLRARSIRVAAFTGATGAIDFIIRIGSTAALARLLLPEHFGLVMMVTAVTAVADQFRDLGLSSATVQRKEITHEEVSNLFWVNCAAGSLIALVVCAISPLISLYYKESRLTLITCVLASNFIWGGVMVQHQAMLTRQLKLGHTSTVRLSSNFLSTLLAIFMAWTGFGYWALVWREVARNVLLSLGMWVCFPWVPSLPSRKTDVRGLVHFGTHVAGANILASFSSGVDRFLIGRYWHTGPVAMYRQAYQLVVATTEQLIGPIYNVSQPGLSMLQTEENRFRRFYQKVLTATCVASMPLSLFAAVFAPEITRVVLGRKWLDAAPILAILSFGVFVKQAVGSASWVLITRGHARTYLVLTMVQNATMIVFMLIGVQYGTEGVAVADVAATYVLIWPKLHYCLRNSPVSIGAFFAAAGRPAFASLVMYGALSVIRVELPPVGAPACLAIGCLVAALVFPAAWMLIPGGKAELKGFVEDLLHGIQRKTRRAEQLVPKGVNGEHNGDFERAAAPELAAARESEPSNSNRDQSANSGIELP